MLKSIRSKKSAEFFHQPGLEYWFKERRTLIDFRRGPLGSYVDGFAAYLKAKGYSYNWGRKILGMCCHFNAFLIDQGITKCEDLSESLIDSFLDVYCKDLRTTSAFYSPRPNAQGLLIRLFIFTIEIKAFNPPRPKAIRKPYSWILDPYLRHLRDECDLSEVTIQRASMQVGSFLEALRQRVRRNRFNALQAEIIESYVSEHLKSSKENLTSLAGALRKFFRYCASHRYTRTDLSGLIPSVRHYRHASLPKGIEDSALERVLDAIDKDSPTGARDYAIAVLMMAYGIRGISAAELLLDDIDWQHSRIRIRAQKGGKEVILPLLEAVGEAIVRYLPHRFAETSFREVFLSTKAPFRPLSSVAISMIVRGYMKEAGVKVAGGGSRTLRHSWAIRALAHNSPLKSIADVLGHRCIDTTFIYAKADLKTLREVSMPGPKKDEAMATCLFRSSLAFRLQTFLETRRAAGRDDVGTQKILIYLDRFLMSELEPGKPITREIVEHWFKSAEHLSTGTRINRISILRQFCLYLSHFDPRTCMVHRSFVPHRTRSVPHIYTRNEVHRIMAASKCIGPTEGLRSLVFSNLIGLLYSTGLRIGEALKLTIGDVDLKRRLIHIREGKFKKSRYVPLSKSTADHLAAYLHRRQRAGFPTSSTSPVFITPAGGRYGKSTIATIFLEIVRKIGIRGPKGQRGPRIHDFRHTFAVNRLLAWHREGANLFAKLPLLSTYLGHTTVTGTEVYLHATAELLESVGKRFHAHFAIPAWKGKERHDKS